MSKYEIIDIEKWYRKVQYKWFSTFSDPTYGLSVRIDVTEVVNYSKETKTSFFSNFLYVVTRVFNECDYLKIRVLPSGEVVKYEQIDPDFTVKTLDNCFNNAGFIYSSNYQEFYERCRKTIEDNNKTMNYDKEYNLPKYNLFYCSCLTTIDIVSMTHPIKNDDVVSCSVPRVFWDKYLKENDRYYLNLNLTVSHALIDGEELSSAFRLVRKYCLEFKGIIK